jgi:hypothetical protein
MYDELPESIVTFCETCETRTTHEFDPDNSFHCVECDSRKPAEEIDEEYWLDDECPQHKPSQHSDQIDRRL